jgi:hypothetical protein
VDEIGEKAMFGGLAFHLHGNIAVGVSSGRELMVRRSDATRPTALAVRTLARST